MNLVAPRVFAQGRWWSADEVDFLARRRHAAALRVLPSNADLVAVVVPGSIDGVIAVLAASALSASLVLLPPDTRAWRSDPPIPAGTLFLLSARNSSLAEEVKRLGHRPLVLDDRDTAAPPIQLLTSPGAVVFTSGSTGLPKPVFRPSTSLRTAITQRLATLPFPDQAGIVSGDSLAHGQGLSEFLLACRPHGAFAPLDPLNMRAALTVLAMPEFGVWFTTPQVAEMVSRLPMEAGSTIPPVCLVAGVTSRKTARAFAERFGRVIRQHYGSSESGPVSIENAPDAEIRPDTVGHLAHDVEVRVGDDPHHSLPFGAVGRLWVKGGGSMEGYGFPPFLDRSGFVDGWWPTRDLGSVDADGYLTLTGRIDDCIRVRDGRLVNLGLVAARLRDADGVIDAVAVPMETSTGKTFGAVVEGEVVIDEVRRHLVTELPPWSWPRELLAVRALPRLANGKIDRTACRRLLLGEVQS